MNPFSGEIHDNKIFGRGAADMKAGIIAMTVAYSYLYRLRDQLNAASDARYWRSDKDILLICL